jgi:hypothetical protein
MDTLPHKHCTCKAAKALGNGWAEDPKTGLPYCAECDRILCQCEPFEGLFASMAVGRAVNAILEQWPEDQPLCLAIKAVEHQLRVWARIAEDRDGGQP